MPEKNLLRVATRMLIDYLKVLDEEKENYEIGCRCKSPEIAVALQELLGNMLGKFPANLSIKDECIVIITESGKQSLRSDN